MNKTKNKARWRMTYEELKARLGIHPEVDIVNVNVDLNREVVNVVLSSDNPVEFSNGIEIKPVPEGCEIPTLELPIWKKL